MLETNLNRLKAALDTSDMEQVETHLLVLQDQLQKAPHLVDMLLPEDIGLLVSAERTRCTEEILAASKPKKRASKPRKTKAAVTLDSIFKTPITAAAIKANLEEEDDF